MRRPFFELSDPDFLFDPQYIMGSNSHRYEGTGWASQHYDIVKAVGLRDFPHLHERHAFFSAIQPNFCRILTMRFRSRFLRPFLGRGFVDMCKKIRHTGSQFRPNIGQISPLTKFQIFTFPTNGGGAIGPNPRPFLSDPQGGNV